MNNDMHKFQTWSPSEATLVQPMPEVKPHDGTPRGWVKVEAYTDGSRIVVEGSPAEDDEEHDCDQMGCGFQHVLAIAEIHAWQRPSLKRAYGISETLKP